IKRALELDCQLAARRKRNSAIAHRLEQLTQREREVMHLVVAGKLNKQIADQLDISMKTVEAHRARVMEKMGVRTLAELVKAVMSVD
ncbi:MAG: LuxR C-terminal-related transcriptional regulator, partial [Azonexus sp.]